MNLVAKQIYGLKKNLGWNTYIGGVSAYLGTPALLATKLGISIVNITNFVVEGSDIKCRITANYSIPGNCFNNDINITYYKDIDGKCTSILGYGFGVGSGGAVFIEAYFPNVTFVAENGFSCGNGTTPNMDYIYIPRCAVLGASPSTDSAVFGGAYRSFISKLYVDVSLQTVNAGSPDPDLTTYPSLTGNVVYVTNFTPPNAVSNLTAGTIYNTAIQLNFTPPSSTNTIDFYEVYVNGVFKKKITASGEVVDFLAPITNYNITILAVDIFYNKSLTSNILNVSTTSMSITDTDSLNYIYASGIYTSSEQNSANSLIENLKSNSLWTKMQAVYLFKGNSAFSHKFNAKNPLNTDTAFRLIFNGSPSFSNLGYLTGGGYADTKLIPSVTQALNSNGVTASLGLAISETYPAGHIIGSEFASGMTRLFVRDVSIVMNLNSTTNEITSNSGANGVYTITKTSSTVAKAFKNNSVLINGSGGGALSTNPFYIGKLNSFGTPFGSTAQRIQIISIHEGLSDAEVTTLHSIIDTSETIAGRKTW
jgi:hypothetical protein